MTEQESSFVVSQTQSRQQQAAVGEAKLVFDCVVESAQAHAH